MAQPVHGAEQGGSGRGWAGERVLVTGARGFLGGRLVARLAAAGAEVTALARPGGGALRRDLDCRWIEADPTDAGQLARAFDAARPAAVFHLGAQPLVGTALADPAGTFEANIRATWALCAAAQAAGCVRGFVFVSTERVYGPGPEPVCTEETPARGRHPYDVSKHCAELIVQSHAASLGLPAGVLRLTNLVGAGDMNLQRLVPGTLVSALRGEAPVLRSDGGGLRDFLPAAEAVEAMLLLARGLARPEAGLRGEVFNIASGRPQRVLDVVRACLAAAGRPDLRPRVAADVPDTSSARPLAVAKAAARLGWRPSGDLTAALAEAAAWYAGWRERCLVRP